MAEKSPFHNAPVPFSSSSAQIWSFWRVRSVAFWRPHPWDLLNVFNIKEGFVLFLLSCFLCHLCGSSFVAGLRGACCRREKGDSNQWDFRERTKHSYKRLFSFFISVVFCICLCQSLSMSSAYVGILVNPCLAFTTSAVILIISYI